jgi:hypothetical protein
MPGRHAHLGDGRLLAGGRVGVGRDQPRGIGKPAKSAPIIDIFILRQPSFTKVYRIEVALPKLFVLQVDPEIAHEGQELGSRFNRVGFIWKITLKW